MTTDLTGAAIEEYFYEVSLAFLAIITALSLSVAAYRRVGQNVPSGGGLKSHVSLVLIVFGLLANPGLTRILVLALNDVDLDASEATPEAYRRLPPEDIQFNGKNLVYLYLESFERTYLDQQIFPGLAPNLRRLEAEGLSFSNMEQAVGTGWTIAGMVASQCGVPLAVRAGGNPMTGYDQFLPGTACVGDVLSEHQYTLYYLGGASLRFAGKGTFYKTHGFTSVLGFDELEQEELIQPTYRSKWGTYDDTLITLIKQQYDALVDSQKPFGLFTLTLDTHHPKGHISRRCKDVRYRDGSNLMLNAVHCADILIGELVDHLMAHKAFKDTVLVIASDHLAFENRASSLLNLGKRRNLFFVLNPDIEPVQIEVPTTTIDINSIIFTALGVKGVGLGFASDILEGEESISQKASVADRHRKFLLSLWSFPSLEEEIEMERESQVAKIGRRTVKYPVLIEVDDDLMITSLRYQPYDPPSSFRHLIRLPFDQKFVWIDTCERIRKVFDRVHRAPKRKSPRPSTPVECSRLVSDRGAVWRGYVDNHGDLVKAYRLGVAEKKMWVNNRAEFGLSHYFRHGITESHRRIDTDHYIVLGSIGAYEVLVLPVYEGLRLTEQEIREYFEASEISPVIARTRLEKLLDQESL